MQQIRCIGTIINQAVANGNHFTLPATQTCLIISSAESPQPFSLFGLQIIQDIPKEPVYLQLKFKLENLCEKIC